ncbi:MAG: class I SAM-dependent methyltransferase [Burkholderiales bacterium]|nr:class I SAM-dependent methyltransferase [Burkholderiales bacterium]
MADNVYGRALTDAEIAAGIHRDFVGGLWDEVGRLQFDYLRAHGLLPQHRLLDVGCGALRGGIHFVRYLAPGHYHGLDVNASLLAAGRRELAAAGLGGLEVHLVADDGFRADRFGVRFDLAIAVSLFTHLPMNSIVRCLAAVGPTLAPGARFHASYFEAPAAVWLDPLPHAPGDIVTHYDRDPYHYAFAELRLLGGLAGLAVERIGDWQHPRGQRMAAFFRA